GGGRYAGCGAITVTGGVVVAVGGSGGALSGSASNWHGSIKITGGTIIGVGGIGIGKGSYFATSISGAPVIFGTAINTNNPGAARGILIGTAAVTISPSGSPTGKTGTLTLNTDITVPAGAALIIPPGWTLNTNGRTITNNGTIINLGTINPPLPDIDFYTLTFDMKGHGTTPPALSVESKTGHTALRPRPDPSFAGVSFLGWYKDAASTIPWDFANTPVTADKTVYAGWGYAVTLDKNGGNADGSAAVKVDGNSLLALTAPIKTGYAVEGYYDDADFSHKVADGAGVLQSDVTDYTDSDGKWIMASNTTLYAGWTPKTYAVTLTAGGSGTDGSATATYDSGILTDFTAAMRTDCTLEGYYTASTGGTKIIDASGALIAGIAGYTNEAGKWKKDGDVTLYAHWTYNLTAEVTADPNGDNGKVTTGYLLVSFTHPDVTVAGFDAATDEHEPGAWITGDAAMGTVTDNGDSDADPYGRTWRVNIFPTSNGTATLAINGWTAANGNIYTVTSVNSTNGNIGSATVYKAIREPTPETVAIDYENERLINLTGGANYKIDGAERTAQGDINSGYIAIEPSWMDDADHSIVKAGGDDTVDSIAQPLEIPARPAAPTELYPIDEASEGGKGSITDVTTAMEYRKAGDTDWSNCSTSSITDLDAGAYYYVRYAATVASFGGESAAVYIHAFRETNLGDAYEGYDDNEILTKFTKGITDDGANITDVTFSPDTDNFTLSGGALWTISPNTGLSVGEHKASITLSYDGDTPASSTQDVTFRVHKLAQIVSVTQTDDDATGATSEITITFANNIALAWEDLAVSGGAVKSGTGFTDMNADTPRTTYTLAVTPLMNRKNGEDILVSVNLNGASFGGAYDYQAADPESAALASNSELEVIIPRAITSASAVTPIPGYSTSYIQFTLDDDLNPIDTDAIEANPGSVEIKVGNVIIPATRIYRVDNDMGYTFRAMITPTVGGAATISVPGFGIGDPFSVVNDVVKGSDAITDVAFALDANGNNYLTDTDDARQVLSAIDLRTGVPDAPPIYAAPALELRMNREYAGWRVVEFYIGDGAYTDYVQSPGETLNQVFDGVAGDPDYPNLTNYLKITLPEGWTCDNGIHELTAVLTDGSGKYAQFLAKVQVDGLAQTYSLKITGGTADSGSYPAGRCPAGAQISISATPSGGQTFDRWEQNTGDSIKITLPKTASGTITMPAGAVSLTAIFKSDPGIGTGVSTPPAQTKPEEPEAPPEPELPAETKTPKLPFIDVTEGEDWFYDDVAWVYGKGLMIGTGETTFEPQTPITRAMLVTILYRYEQSSRPAVGDAALVAPAAQANGEPVFDDVPPDQWYTEAVAWGAANGIVKGYGDGRFGPDDAITREQLAAVLYRYEQHSGKAPDDIA
ncbi:MAG: S-layer homology domain-containing protein, partial [Oscillospiraceae bacterium]|nr:S-layer homology domain-containing protein [Oscillospiraceae bacterium]